jgi:hypothetical protein
VGLLVSIQKQETVVTCRNIQSILRSKNNTSVNKPTQLKGGRRNKGSAWSVEVLDYLCFYFRKTRTDSKGLYLELINDFIYRNDGDDQD